MWCKGPRVNEQPDHGDNHQSPCAGGPWSWYRPILFSKQKPINPKIQCWAHRSSAVGDAYNHHPFLKGDFPCRKWLFCGNASNPCDHVNPLPALMVEMSVLQMGAFLWYQPKRLNKNKAILLEQIHIQIDTVTVLGRLRLFILAKRHWGPRLWQVPGYRCLTAHPPSWHFH